MFRSRWVGILGSLAMLGALLTAAPASATPFVNIRTAWSVGPYFRTGLPEGAVVSCYGDARAIASGCNATLSLVRSSAEPTSILLTASGGLRLTNATDHALDGDAYFGTDFSSFNPGGPGYGIGIDDPLTQAARFVSSVSGKSVGDSQRCSVGYLGTSGNFVNSAGTSCGVASPDSSGGLISIDTSLIAPGQSVDIYFSMDIFYELATLNPTAAVPAPASALLLLTGTIALLRRRRAG